MTAVSRVSRRIPLSGNCWPPRTVTVRGGKKSPVGQIHKLQRWFQPSMNASIAATRSLAEVKVRGGWLGG
jgi:hypothetical protein